jgi:hypothetical protein
MPAPSQATRMLALLQVRPRTAAEIEQLAGRMRVNSRAADLRRNGHNVTCRKIKGKGAAGYLYELHRGRLEETGRAATRSGTDSPDAGSPEHAHRAPVSSSLSVSPHRGGQAQLSLEAVS